MVWVCSVMVIGAEGGIGFIFLSSLFSLRRANNGIGKSMYSAIVGKTCFA